MVKWAEKQLPMMMSETEQLPPPWTNRCLYMLQASTEAEIVIAKQKMIVMLLFLFLDFTWNDMWEIREVI